MGNTSVAERAVILNAMAQPMQDNLAMLTEAETWDNDKPIRETNVSLAISSTSASVLNVVAETTGPKFFLEHAHLVATLQHRWLEVVATLYGRGAGVWTRDIKPGLRF